MGSPVRKDLIDLGVAKVPQFQPAAGCPQQGLALVEGGYGSELCRIESLALAASSSSVATPACPGCRTVSSGWPFRTSWPV